MRFIYNFGLKVYLLLVKLSASRNPKARKWLDGRKKLLKRIKSEKGFDGKSVWVHCSSLGEFEQGRPLIEEIRKRFPEKKIVLTFFSPSGYEVQKDYKNVDYVCYLPLDTRKNAKKFIKEINPEVVFFIKYEYWYNFLKVLKKKSVPVYFVSSIFREDQLFFKWYGGWYRKMLKLATHFFIQNQESADLLEKLDIHNYTITGDTRFDRVAHIFENVKPLPVIEQFLDSKKAIIAGSSWKAEEALLMQYLRIYPALKIIIAPHEVNEENISRITKQFGENNTICYSKATPSSMVGKKVMIIDCYGLLTSLYQYSLVSIVGGGFGAGIHNVLEPAAFGMPVIFGPNYEKFREARELVEINSAFPVNNIEEFNTLMTHLLKDASVINTISKKAASYVKENVGATNKIISTVFNS
jgi:3-deoxy-D-manno-octulosonic-acid transferase